MTCFQNLLTMFKSFSISCEIVDISSSFTKLIFTEIEGIFLKILTSFYIIESSSVHEGRFSEMNYIFHFIVDLRPSISMAL